jgi:hypothetical protein
MKEERSCTAAVKEGERRAENTSACLIKREERSSASFSCALFLERPLSLFTHL